MHRDKYIDMVVSRLARITPGWDRGREGVGVSVALAGALGMPWREKPTFLFRALHWEDATRVEAE